MKSKTMLCIGLIFLFAFASFAMADPLIFATGQAKKGYSKVYANVNAVCGSHVPMKERVTDGGLANLTDLASKEATVGIASYGVFMSMSGTDDTIARLKGVVQLNSQLVHIIVNENGYVTGRTCSGKVVLGKCWGSWVNQTKVINKVEDLNGITMGAVGSGSVVGRTLFKKLNINVAIRDIDKDNEALAALARGEIAAVMTTAAYPAGPVSAIKQGSGFKLLSWNLPAPTGYKLVKKNYKNMGAFGVAFLAEPNILFARPVDPNGDIGNKITALQTCIKNNFRRFKDGDGFEQSWNDSMTTNVPDDIAPWNGGTVRSGKKQK